MRATARRGWSPTRPELVRISSETRPEIVRKSSESRPKLVISGRRFSPNPLIRHDSRPGNFPFYRHFSSFIVISGRNLLRIGSQLPLPARAAPWPHPRPGAGENPIHDVQERPCRAITRNGEVKNIYRTSAPRCQDVSDVGTIRVRPKSVQLASSRPRKRASRMLKNNWIPAFAGMTA